MLLLLLILTLHYRVCLGEGRHQTADPNAEFTITTKPQDNVQRAKSILGLISDDDVSQDTTRKKILKTIKKSEVEINKMRLTDVPNSINIIKSTQSITREEGATSQDGDGGDVRYINNKLKKIYQTTTEESQQSTTTSTTTTTGQETLISGRFMDTEEEQINWKQLFHHEGQQSEVTDKKQESTLYKNSINHKLLDIENHPLNLDEFHSEVYELERVKDEKDDIKIVPLVSTAGNNKIEMVKGKEGKRSMSLYEKVVGITKLNGERNIRDSEERDRGDSKENQESERQSVQDSKENQESERQSVEEIKERSGGGGGEINLMRSDGDSFKENVKEGIDKLIIERSKGEHTKSESVRKDEEKEGKERNKVVEDNKVISNKEKVIKKVKEAVEEKITKDKKVMHMVDQILSNVEEEENQKKKTTPDGKEDNSKG
ncbi:hypothetical protein Pcinc_019694 [Petrolisthes cinctipes]|uniref:Uncharacterized protein n=1 Tax=Petrolisthes cinctipes TaxID=88211 RepID=A0AAE1KL81_PETCI|nr:hypothetical protein Pcinc_019694 [Petrolisthes cinctipes]